MFYYSLRINAPEEIYDEINKLLGVDSNYPEAGWGIKIEANENTYDINIVDYFLSLLEGKYDELSKIGVQRDDITIWMLYEYDGQCNMEIFPKEMYDMGRNGIALCISCWEK